MMALRDQCGTPYSSPDGKPAGSGVAVTIHGPNGGIAGHMVGGVVVPDKR
jgi:hypothetical protein